ncbi:hypothetical protein [uncultured Sphingopyxis sp.]|jgi:hypothetical protein|uniref:hypothetical protein n=1 Tax=uncultured Sphingopyxis sp. TaxID=310581 RepID=UPI000A83305D|nr:hypothetical protein [uncultured Sphingopyxis sp.]
MAEKSDGEGWVVGLLLMGGVYWAFSSGGGCDKYASKYSCSYVEKKAEYEVWYWRHLERDDGADETYIGRAKGIRMCEDNARAYAASIGEPWNYRAYICVLMDDGHRMEKHRNLG